MNNDETEKKDSKVKLVEDHVARLSEHFDSVQIFVTKHDNAAYNGTRNINWGTGNWFARYGQVMEWLKRTENEIKEGT